MKTGIVIPWRPQPSRLAAFDFVMSWYREMYPDYPIYLADGGDGPFNISAARNTGCKEAFEDDCDVVIVSDADALVEKRFIDEAVAYARRRNSVAFPFNWTGYATYDMTNEILYNEGDWVNGPKVSLSTPHLVSGVYVISRIAFEDVNGWDERFVGWGHEDVAFYVTFKTLHGEIKRFDGDLLFLYHEDRDFSNEPANAGRLRIYDDTIKDFGEEGLRNLIKDNMP
jgi:predicted glycosyltransferase involved in capsule biosynthesis